MDGTLVLMKFYGNKNEVLSGDIMKKPEMYDENPMEYVRVALAIETIAYHHKDYLSQNLRDNSKISEEVQALLTEAINMANK